MKQGRTIHDASRFQPLDLSPVVPVAIKGHPWQCFCVRTFRPEEGHTSHEHLVLVHAPDVSMSHADQAVFSANETVSVRIHSECLFGDVFGSDRCDCGSQLALSLDAICHDGQGVFVYLRQEGRGIGLFDKIRSMTVNDIDSFVRNEVLGLPGDRRDFALAAHIVWMLGVRSARLLSGNPQKIASLQALGIDTTPVSCIPTTGISQEAQNELLSKMHRGYRYPCIPAHLQAPDHS